MPSQRLGVDHVLRPMTKCMPSQTEADGPAVRRVDQMRGDVVGIVHSVGLTQELCGLLRGEAEILAMYLGDLAPGPEQMPWKSFLVAGTHDHSKIVRPSLEQIRQGPPYRGISQPMGVVEHHECLGRAECSSQLAERLDRDIRDRRPQLGGHHGGQLVGVVMFFSATDPSQCGAIQAGHP